MATANYIVTRALTRLGVRAAETPVEDVEMRDGVQLLNDMLSNWEPLYQLGFIPVDSEAAEVRIPREAVLAVIDSLAIAMAPEYSKPVPQSLVIAADTSLTNMLNSITDIGDVDFPSTLPIGSGNSCDDSTDIRFFPEKNKVNF